MKRIFRYLNGQPKLGLWYPRDSPFDLEAYSDSDYAATSTTKAEYVAAAGCCGQMGCDWYGDYLGFILFFGDQPPLTELSLEHDTFQDVNLEGTGGSGRGQVKLPYDSPLLGGHTYDSAEGRLNLEELSVLCTNLSNTLLSLEIVKDAQAKEILALKDRIKNLEKKCKPSITHHRAWLRSVAKLSKMKKLGQMEFVSKQGRKSAKPRPKLDDSARLNADGVEYMETEEVVDEGKIRNKTEELNLDADTEVINEDKGSDEKGERISTARPKRISTARPKRVSTFAITINTANTKVSAVEPKNPPTTTNKGKAVLEEPEPKTMTKSDFDATQVTRDEEIARQLEAELHKEEKYIVDKRAKLLTEYLERRKKQLAEERAADIRNKPPTRTQLRRLMMTYHKHT
nr:hypothetical protein [Tanacetum cinerariifolium]